MNKIIYAILGGIISVGLLYLAMKQEMATLISSKNPRPLENKLMFWKEPETSEYASAKKAGLSRTVNK